MQKGWLTGEADQRCCGAILLLATLLVLPGTRAWALPDGPTIIVQPTFQTVAKGSDARLQVSARGANLRYQWWFNGSVLSNATNASYLIAPVEFANSGNYQLVVSDVTASVNSEVVQLTVVDAGQSPPTISALASQTIDKNSSAGPLNLIVTGQEAAGNDLTLSADSSNTNLMPKENISFLGEGANRTVTFTPANNQSGRSTIKVTVTDANGNSAGTVFVLTVHDANQSPEFVGDPPISFHAFTAPESIARRSWWAEPSRT